MKDSSKLLPIFTSFFREINNQFGQVIKILRSDNVKEYFSSTFLHFRVHMVYYTSPLVLIHHSKMV